MRHSNFRQHAIPLALSVLLLFAGCMSIQPDELDPVLTANIWELIQIQSMDDNTYRPSSSGRYWLNFQENGALAVSTDCNQHSGSWSRTDATLTIELALSTRMACPPQSLHDRFIRDLGAVRSLLFRDGRLYLATFADGAILELQPAAE